MICQLCRAAEAKYRYAGFDICKNDYNLTLRTAEKMRAVIRTESESYVMDAEPKDVILEVIKRRAELNESNKWAGNKKPKVENPSIAVFGSRHSDEGEE